MTENRSRAGRKSMSITRSVIRMSGAGLTVGTPIMTPMGQISVEDLKRGDRVLTKDYGYQTIKCIGFRDVDLRRSDTLSPIRLSAECLGQQRPMHDLYLAPSQRLAIRHPLFDPIFGTREVVACAGDLTDLAGVDQVSGLKGITYVFLGFTSPQLMLTGSLALDLGGPNDRTGRMYLSADEAKLACGLLAPQFANMTRPSIISLH